MLGPLAHLFFMAPPLRATAHVLAPLFIYRSHTCALLHSLPSLGPSHHLLAPYPPYPSACMLIDLFPLSISIDISCGRPLPSLLIYHPGPMQIHVCIQASPSHKLHLHVFPHHILVSLTHTDYVCERQEVHTRTRSHIQTRGCTMEHICTKK